MNVVDVLKASTFGSRTAEEEQDKLELYFVETEQWRRVLSGEIDIVYGPKGSGKSAIYSLILKNATHLFDNNVIAVAGERPKGAPAFSTIENDMPENETEFVNLWKIYILSLVGQQMRDYGISNEPSRKVYDALGAAGIIPQNFSLGKFASLRL